MGDDKTLSGGEFGRFQNTKRSRFPQSHSTDTEGKGYWIEEYRSLLENISESAYILAGEDSVKAKEIMYWTTEQYLEAIQNMDKKVDRINRERKKKK
jgi:hypothetical protein